jgi:hypothetical protein
MYGGDSATHGTLILDIVDDELTRMNQFCGSEEGFEWLGIHTEDCDTR